MVDIIASILLLFWVIILAIVNIKLMNKIDESGPFYYSTPIDEQVDDYLLTEVVAVGAGGPFTDYFRVIEGYDDNGLYKRKKVSITKTEFDLLSEGLEVVEE